MIKISTLIYYINLIVVSASLGVARITVTDWLWWVCIIGVIVARICGKEEER